MTFDKLAGSKPFSMAWPILSIASVSAGIYNGYCNAAGIPISNEYLENLIAYGPAIAQGGLYSIVGGLLGAVSGKEEGKDFDWGESTAEKIAKKIGGTKIGAIYGIAFCGPYGAAKGSIQNLAGFGLGCIIGWASK